MESNDAEPKKRRTYPKPDDAFLVTCARLCQILKLPYRWVLRKARTGALPCARIGHNLLFNPDTVKKHLMDKALKNQFGVYPHDED